MDFRLLRFRLRLKIIVFPVKALVPCCRGFPFPNSGLGRVFRSPFSRSPWSRCTSPKLHSEAARLTSCVYGSEEGLIQKVGEDR